jgi:hypothetical protein
MNKISSSAPLELTRGSFCEDAYNRKRAGGRGLAGPIT